MKPRTSKSMRAQTVALQERYPLGVEIEFWDEAGRARFGQVVGHQRGLLVVRWPLHRRASGIPKASWEAFASRERISAEQVVRAL